jgi:PTH1 family peptidyl-tRNA hydrolase
MEDAWLVVGLGNPGERYERSRHNMGGMVVDRLSQELGVRLRKVRFSPVLAGETRHRDQSLILAKPGTWMNESGPPIASFAKRRGIPVSRVIVCHDEIDLPFGSLRLKKGGSTAGHHGLDSLVQAFRSPDFYRVRLGVGRPPSREVGVDHVLAPIPKRHLEEVGVVVAQSADAVLTVVTEGLAAAQERFNRSGIAKG